MRTALIPMGAIGVRLLSPNLWPGERVGRAHADAGAGRIIGVDEDDACLLETLTDFQQRLRATWWDTVMGLFK